MAEAVTPEPEKKKGSKRKKKLKPYLEFLKIPGLKKIPISENGQRVLSCNVGEEVSPEDPWIYIHKQMFYDDLMVLKEDSEFFPIKDDIDKYPEEELLIGYIPEERHKVHEFFICTTLECKNAVQAILNRKKVEQEENFRNRISRRTSVWKGYGSEKYVDELQLKRNRPLYEIEVSEFA